MNCFVLKFIVYLFELLIELFGDVKLILEAMYKLKWIQDRLFENRIQFWEVLECFELPFNGNYPTEQLNIPLFCTIESIPPFGVLFLQCLVEDQLNPDLFVAVDEAQ